METSGNEAVYSTKQYKCVCVKINKVSLVYCKITLNQFNFLKLNEVKQIWINLKDKLIT